MRLLTAPMALLVALLIPIAPANAGGAHLEWEKEFYIPGDVVRGRAWVEIDVRRDGRGGLEDGPYYAYLTKKDSTAPPLPHQSRKVARIEINPRAGGKYAEAKVVFVLPVLDPGYYWILNCNDPCRHTFGDLAVGQINVVADKSEARVLDLAFRIAAEVSRVGRRVERRVLGGQRSSLSTRLTALEERVDELEAELQSAKLNAANTSSPPSSYPMAAFVLGSVAAGALVIRRKRGKRERS